jgi:osmotically-inducible protein OsmY
MRVFPVFLFLGLALAPPVAPAHPEEATKAVRKAGPAEAKGVAPADAQLEQAIRARFARSKIAAENFQVSVRGGVATLTGKTSVVQRKGAATRLARLAGAKSVRNRIETEARVGQRAQGRRRVQVQRGAHD